MNSTRTKLVAKLVREQLSRFIFVSELGVNIAVSELGVNVAVSELGVNVAGGTCGVVSVGVIGWSCVDVILRSKENDKSLSSKCVVSGSVYCIRARGLGHSETGFATLTESCFSPGSFSFGMRSKMSYNKSSILACRDLIGCSSIIILSLCDEGILGDEWDMLTIYAHRKIMDRIKTV